MHNNVAAPGAVIAGVEVITFIGAVTVLPQPATEYVMVVLPVDTGITAPVDAFTEAIAVLLELHVPPEKELVNEVAVPVFFTTMLSRYISSP